MEIIMREKRMANRVTAKRTAHATLLPHPPVAAVEAIAASMNSSALMERKISGFLCVILLRAASNLQNATVINAPATLMIMPNMSQAQNP